MEKIIKKSMILFLINIIFFSAISSVYASVLSINNVSDKFNNLSLMDEFAVFGISATSSVDSSNKTFNINVNAGEETLPVVLNYGDDYIEYNNRDFVVTEENYSETFPSAIGFMGVLESVLELCGYENMTLSEDQSYVDTYDTYGIQIESESYSFEGSDENGSWSISGDVIKYFKISLDTDKIDLLMSTYGVPFDEQDSNEEIIQNLIPIIEVQEITENSITLYAKINNYYNTDNDYNIMCNIYRSNNADGPFDKISNEPVDCLNPNEVIDKELESNTTYYYKAVVDGGTKFSDIISVTTKISQNTENIENPSTGGYFPIIEIAILLLGGLILILYSKKKNIFKKI